MIKRKTSMTAFDVAAVVRQLSGLQGSRLANIYAYNGGFLLRFKGAEDARVVVVPAVRLHATRYEPAERGTPPPLVMGLRKYIRGARLESVEQHGFDRIAVFRFSRGNGSYVLVTELLPRGVVVLADSSWKILHASEQREMRDRVIRRGVEYQFPPSNTIHPSQLAGETVEEALSSGSGEAIRILARRLGYPGEVLEEVFARLDIPVDASADSLAGRGDEIAEAIRRLYEECMQLKGYIVYDKGVPLTVTCFEPRGLAARYGFEYRAFNDPSTAYDEYFLTVAREAAGASTVAAEIEAERKKLLASLEAARRNLEHLRKKLRELEELAEIVSTNIADVYDAVECARKMRETAGWEQIPGNCPGVVDVEPNKGIIKISIVGNIVPIDIRMEPGRLVVDLYKRIGEVRAKIERGEKAVKDIEARLAELEEKVRQRLLRARAMVRRKEWYEKYHWVITSHGYLAIGGRDASQNESVVKRYLNDKRIFMHADIHGAPAVVFFAEGQTPPEQDLREAAAIAAAYSKAWKAGIGSVDVYWVWGSQVSKAAPAGEYLAKGAFMVYGKRNYIRNVEVKIAIGIGLEDEYSPVVIVGPDSLVRRRSIVYAVLAPGDEDPSKLAKRLRSLLAGKAGEYKPIIEAVGVEELRERIPGRARVLYVGRGSREEPPRPLRILHGEES
ncbi:ribosome rescue protein RqcH [Hyperthermus butylicus]|uniref:Universally conserved protein n=1 Tax=Hyperthermus butylicus (strain DSM 5456 / JCM 9403 / PLM1-5) TaxID=415426 RepID=A2BLT7_HYPBU|nr:ribosome rescue protein RqcH [Hyperthermus butylicus]ABM80948.1 universally conserved protein [Hyperthermus butylicus DSM 5456]